MASIALRLASSSARRIAHFPMPSLSQTKRTQLTLRRNLHTRNPLPYDIDNGLGDFLTPQALRMVAIDYQQGLLDRLNEQIQGTRHERQSVAQIVIETAPEPSQSLAFNYASEALNNGFFLDYLAPPPEKATNHEEDISTHLRASIRMHLGSVAQLRSNVSAAAMGMISTGYVWFVTDSQGNMGVVATYGAGTLLTKSRIQGESPLDIKFSSLSSRARSDPSAPLSGSSPTSPASGLSHQPPPMHPSSPSRALHTSSLRQNDNSVKPRTLFQPKNASRAPPSLSPGFSDHQNINFEKLGDVLFPLFCVSVHEHNWVASGYGVWGKERYLANFWTCLDWGKVSDAYQRFVPDTFGLRDSV